MPEFEVIQAGATVDGVKYTEGDTFTHDKDLDKLFKNKFKRLGGKTKKPRDHDPRLNESGGKQGDRPEAVRRTPGATQGRPDPNRTARSTPQDLDFEVANDEEGDEEVVRVEEEEEEAAAKPKGRKAAAPEEEEEPKPKGKKAEQEAESQFGEDQTDYINGAEEAGLKVFKDPETRKYTVVKASKPGKAIHTEELTTKQQVIKLVRENKAE